MSRPRQQKKTYPRAVRQRLSQYPVSSNQIWRWKFVYTFLMSQKKGVNTSASVISFQKLCFWTHQSLGAVNCIKEDNGANFWTASLQKNSWWVNATKKTTEGCGPAPSLRIFASKPRGNVHNNKKRTLIVCFRYLDCTVCVRWLSWTH